MVIFKSAFMIFTNILVWAIIIRSFASFMFQRPNTFTEILYGFTEPILHPVRKLMNSLGISTGAIDFSPLVAIIIINIIRSIVLSRL